MVTIILSILALISAILHIKAEKYSANFYIFKPLTMVFVLLMAIYLSTFSINNDYNYLIIIGLIFSLVGDIFLMLPKDKFVAGLVSFLIAHIFYIIAFTLTGITSFSLFYLIPFLLYGTILFNHLLPFLKEMKIPVAIYATVLLIMGWQAFSRWIDFAPPSSLVAFIGALFFMASDSILALDRFKGSVKSAQFYFMSTYFFAQWLIALSIK
ncbi:MAG: lysoplasmalogenase [Acidobacteria bacterium]|nr:lysoplasmalogenase [Acidobacteriota bacterium]